MAGVAGRYASALFDVANEERKLAEVDADVSRLQQLLDQSDDLGRMVRSPVFSAEEQGRAISAVAERAGLSSLTSNFLKLLARSRRMFVLSDSLRMFRQLLASHRGEVTADVVSAHPLSPDQISALTTTLGSAVGAKRVRVNTRVDPALLGGLVVKIGGRLIDSSLRTKLDTLKIRMKEVR